MADKKKKEDSLFESIKTKAKEAYKDDLYIRGTVNAVSWIKGGLKKDLKKDKKSIKKALGINSDNAGTGKAPSKRKDYGSK